jgi:ABC-type branched-subunit amino acid transport system ATPase component
MSSNIILDVKGVSIAFGGLKAVNNASLTVERGSITSVIGPNGAGKTTLFNLVSGSLTADSGSITLDSQSIEKLRPHQIAHLGLIRTFQGAKIIKRLSVLENIVLAGQNNPGEKLWRILTPKARKNYENAAKEKAMGLLKDVGLDSLADSYAGILSGGQRKLLDLSRCLMADPKIMLLDEPFAGVNPALVEKLLSVLNTIREKHSLSFLLVEHDLETVMTVSDKVVVMAQGAVITSGLPGSIYENQDVIDAYLGTRKRSA